MSSTILEQEHVCKICFTSTGYLKQCAIDKNYYHLPCIGLNKKRDQEEAKKSSRFVCKHCTINLRLDTPSLVEKEPITPISEPRTPYLEEHTTTNTVIETRNNLPTQSELTNPEIEIVTDPTLGPTADTTPACEGNREIAA